MSLESVNPCPYFINKQNRIYFLLAHVMCNRFNSTVISVSVLPPCCTTHTGGTAWHKSGNISMFSQMTICTHTHTHTHRHCMLRIGDEALLISELLRLCRAWTCTSSVRVDVRTLMDGNSSTSSWHAVRAAWHTAGHCALIKEQMGSSLKITNIHPAGTTSACFI